MKNRTILKALPCAFLTALLFSFTSLYAQGDQTAIKVKTSTAGATTGAWLHLPDDYSSTTERYPLIIFIHGLGEKGTDLNLVLNQGLPKLIARGAKMNFTVGGKVYKFIVLSPQFFGGWASAEMTQSIIDDMKARYRVDASRIYLTGLSAGGQGVWTYVSTSKQHAENLAAIVPVSPAGMGAQLVANICNSVVAANVPVWQFAGSSDVSGGISFLSNMRMLETTYNSCSPAIAAKSTVVQGGGHDAVTWDRVYDPTHTYNNPNIYEWMLQYSKGGVTQPPPVTPTPPVANAGPEINLTLPANNALLDGSASKPSNAAIAGYEWRKLTGPAQFNISGDKTVKANLSNLVEGTYTFELKVTDVNGLSATAQTQVTVAAAQACSSCKIVAKPDGLGVIDGNTVKAQPGDTVCITAGNYVSMRINNFTGTAEKPIVIMNCGGKVVIGNNGNYGLSVESCKYVKITGTGSSDKYGFLIDGGGQQLNTGMSVGKGCTDYTVDHVEISRVGVGMFAKINPDCNPLNQHPNFVIRNVVLHDLYIHDTQTEGLYVGNTAPNGSEIDCNGQKITVYPPRIENIRIYNVITKNTGWDGIQVSTVPVGAEIFDNDVSEYGMSKAYGQNAGILLGGSASGVVRNNRVNKGAGPCIMVFGIGHIKIYNNMLNGAGAYPIEPNMDDGIFIDDRPNMYPDKPQQVYVFNNTIINPSRNGIKFLSTYGTAAPGNQFYNNLIVGAGTVDTYGDRAYLNVAGGLDYQASNNVFLKNIADAKFKNPAGFDFHLTEGAPAIDVGRSLADQGVTNDFDYEQRPHNGLYDAGADEFTGGVLPNKPPVAYAGNDVTITLPVSSISLKGDASYDPEGGIVTFTWTKINGPAAKIEQPAAANTVISGLTAGTYVFELAVKDDKGAIAKDQITVTVNAGANKPPVAYAGSDVTITLPVSSVSLKGDASYDPEGGAVTFTWTKISGPAAKIEQPAAANTVISGLTAGTYVFELAVKDDKGETAKDQITVTVNAAANKPPVAFAGNDVTITLPVSSVSLKGDASYDPEGGAVTFTWTKISGPAAKIEQPASANTVVSGLAAGTYIFELTVKDNAGAAAADRITVTVNMVNNKLPVANAGTDITIQLPVNTIQLDGRASRDEDGSIVSYSWAKISGPAATIVQPNASVTTVNNLVEGSYVFELTVKDDKEASATARINVRVTNSDQPNRPPVADAGRDLTININEEEILLIGSGSNDPDGRIASYSWRQLDGPSSVVILAPESIQTRIGGAVAGEYVFELTVTDDRGARATATVRITVIKDGAAGKEIEVSLFPNPVSSTLHVRINADGKEELKNINMFILSAEGQMKKHIQLGAAPNIQTEVDVKDLADGIYFIQFTDGLHFKSAKKIVKVGAR